MKLTKFNNHQIHKSNNTKFGFIKKSYLPAFPDIPNINIPTVPASQDVFPPLPSFPTLPTPPTRQQSITPTPRSPQRIDSPGFSWFENLEQFLQDNPTIRNAIFGALLGLGGGFITNLMADDDDLFKRMLLGALAGGGIGALLTYLKKWFSNPTEEAINDLRSRMRTHPTSVDAMNAYIQRGNDLPFQSQLALQRALNDYVKFLKQNPNIDPTTAVSVFSKMLYDYNAHIVGGGSATIDEIIKRIPRDSFAEVLNRYTFGLSYPFPYGHPTLPWYERLFNSLISAGTTAGAATLGNKLLSWISGGRASIPSLLSSAINSVIPSSWGATTPAGVGKFLLGTLATLAAFLPGVVERIKAPTLDEEGIAALVQQTLSNPEVQKLLRNIHIEQARQFGPSTR